MPAGRPPLFSSREELQEKIKEFKAFCFENKRPLTIERLAVVCGCDRETILNYGNKDEFFDTMRTIRSEILAEKIERLNDKESYTPGIVFDLKNNYKYVDKTEVDQRNLNIETSPEELKAMTDEQLMDLLNKK